MMDGEKKICSSKIGTTGLKMKTEETERTVCSEKLELLMKKEKRGG